MWKTLAPTLDRSQWNAYFRDVYDVCEPPAVDDNTFFFYADRLPRAAQPSRVPLLGLNRDAEALSTAWLQANGTLLADADARRAVAPEGGDSAALWSGRRRGEAFYMMCMEGSGARACTAAGRQLASRVESTLWLYPYNDQRRHHPLEDFFPPGGFPSSSRVEVFHCAEREPAVAEDYWMYLARGSGIFFDLGRTIAFRDRYELFVALNATRTPAVPGCCVLVHGPKA